MNQLRVAFFTEAGKKEGMGHLVRCQTIKNIFVKYNYYIDFYLQSDIDFSFKYNNLLKFTWDNFNLTKHYDFIFIDSYIASIDIYNIIYKYCKLAIYIDDYNRLSYPNGVILNFAPDAKDYFKPSSKYTYLLGTNYLPIREEFKYIMKNQKTHIIIILGGSNNTNLSLSSLIINTMDNINIHKVIVVNNISIKKDLEKYTNLTVLYKPDDKILINYMSNSICAISTASMSLYELSALNIPTSIIAVAKNQLIGVKQLIQNKIAKYYVDITKKNWQKELFTYTNLLLKDNTYKSTITLNGTTNIYTDIIRLLK